MHYILSALRILKSLTSGYAYYRAKLKPDKNNNHNENNKKREDAGETATLLDCDLAIVFGLNI
jgi:hypothetical protein